MSRQYDAIIIGTGIIGGAIGLELARRGSRTLNVDKLPAAGTAVLLHRIWLS